MQLADPDVTLSHWMGPGHPDVTPESLDGPRAPELLCLQRSVAAKTFHHVLLAASAPLPFLINW